jgi:LmeA-like phospholipid-binding
MRKLVIGLLVLALAFVVADFVARSYAEDRASTALQDSFHLSKKPTVTLAGFPFLFHAASGHFDSISLSDKDFHVQGVDIRSIELTLHDVHFSLKGLTSGRGGTVRVARGEGNASLTGEAVTELLRGQGAPVTIRFEGGRAVLSSSQLPGEIDGTLSIRRGHLVVASPEAAGSYSLALPEILPGIRYTGVRVDGDAAVVAFEVPKQTFRL